MVLCRSWVSDVGLVVVAFEAVGCCMPMGDVEILSVTQTNKRIFESDVQVTYIVIYFVIEPTRSTIFSNLFLEWDSHSKIKFEKLLFLFGFIIIKNYVAYF